MQLSHAMNIIWEMMKTIFNSSISWNFHYSWRWHQWTGSCQEILSQYDLDQYDVICWELVERFQVLLKEVQHIKRVFGFKRWLFTTRNSTVDQNWSLTDAYCCGGYAKTSYLHLLRVLKRNMPCLLNHGKNDVRSVWPYKESLLSTRILAIHSGGLQADIRNNNNLLILVKVFSMAINVFINADMVVYAPFKFSRLIEYV